MKKQKQNRAITLIALIITVIVLLILAGVSINFIFGNEGILSKTQYAVEQYQNAKDAEETEIAKYTNEIDKYVSGKREDILPELLWTNPSTNKSFRAQTISLDLSSYKYVIIITFATPGYAPALPNFAGIIPVSDGVPTNKSVLGATLSSCTRKCYANATGVVFDDADYNHITDSDDRIIPYYIYGVKSDLELKLNE